MAFTAPCNASSGINVSVTVQRNDAIRLDGNSGPVDIAPGWHWVYTRGYELAVPAGRDLRWMVEHAPSETSRTSTKDLIPSATESRIERRAYRRARVVKITRWELEQPDRVTFHDEVYKGGHLVVRGEERCRFL